MQRSDIEPQRGGESSPLDRPRAVRVVAALYPRALATSIALPMDVLQAAGQAAGVRNARRQPAPV